MCAARQRENAETPINTCNAPNTGRRATPASLNRKTPGAVGTPLFGNAPIDADPIHRMHKTPERVQRPCPEWKVPSRSRNAQNNKVDGSRSTQYPGPRKKTVKKKNRKRRRREQSPDDPRPGSFEKTIIEDTSRQPTTDNRPKIQATSQSRPVTPSTCDVVRRCRDIQSRVGKWLSAETATANLGDPNPQTPTGRSNPERQRQRIEKPIRDLLKRMGRNKGAGLEVTDQSPIVRRTNRRGDIRRPTQLSSSNSRLVPPFVHSDNEGETA